MNTIGKKVTLYSVASALAAAALAVAGPAQAASQGSLGSTSTGSITITASIGAKAQISGLSDLTFSSLDAVNNSTLSQNACVWSNTATKNYTIKATGSGASNAFTVKDASNNVIPYTVAWAATSGASSGTALTSGSASSSIATSATSPTCGGTGSTSTLFVSLAAADQQAMIAGNSYTGTLTLLVTPQ